MSELLRTVGLFKNWNVYQAWWYIPLIPVLRMQRQVELTKVSSGQLGIHRETLSQIKTKLGVFYIVALILPSYLRNK